MYLELWLYVKVFADRSFSQCEATEVPIYHQTMILRYNVLLCFHRRFDRRESSPARTQTRRKSNKQAAATDRRGREAARAKLKRPRFPRPWQGCQKAYHILAQNMTSGRASPTPHRANDSAHIGRHLCCAILSRHHGPQFGKL